jgi:AAA domain
MLPGAPPPWQADLPPEEQGGSVLALRMKIKEQQEALSAAAFMLHTDGDAPPEFRDKLIMAELSEWLRRKARKAVDAIEAASREPIALVPAAVIRGRKPPPELIEGVIPAGPAIGVFFGESGTYKSFLVLHLQLCVGAGSAVAFLGHQVNGGGLAVYVMGEGQADAGLRLDAALSANPAFTDERLAYIEQPFPLSDEATVGEVIARCKELAEQTGQAVALVVFDSFADFYGAGDSENSNTDMQRLIAGMKRIAAELSCVVMANAHTGNTRTDKEGNELGPPERMRGASRFRQAWDFELMATGTALEPTKNRYGPKAEPLRYGVREHGGSLVIAEAAAAVDLVAYEPVWPHPVSADQVGRVTAAVRQTPGMTMTQIASAAKVRKDACGIALLKAQDAGMAVNAGTKNSPKWEPGPMWEWDFVRWAQGSS